MIKVSELASLARLRADIGDAGSLDRGVPVYS